MATINDCIGRDLDRQALNLALQSLSIRLDANRTECYKIVICGGSALILGGLVNRTTQDVDVVALLRGNTLASPDPIPPELAKAVQETAEDLGLPVNWLNNGPSRGDGGLFAMGLPEGFADRLHDIRFGLRLHVYFIDRIDQIHFKLYAAVDRGGYHITDLKALSPTDTELVHAGRWAMMHDVSEAFAISLKQFLRTIGYANASQGL